MFWYLVTILIEVWIMVYEKITGVTVIIVCYYWFCLSSDFDIAFSLYWLYLF